MHQTSQAIKILGIDPGTRIVGFGLISVKGPSLHPSNFSVIDAGIIKLDPKTPLPERLAQLHNAMFRLTGQWQPHTCVLEGAFFGINAQSALKLGQARGALLAAVSRHGIPVHEMSPAHVKKIITGNGQGNKEMVCESICRFLRFDRKNFSFDATDALALALSFGLSQGHLIKPKTPVAVSC